MDHNLDEHNRCQNCGAHVTATFRRVNGDEDGLVHQCYNCSSAREIAPKGVDV